MRLAGRIALITGGAAGIGRATALRFARKGARVAIADVDVVEGERTAAEVDGLFVRCDVTQEAEVQAAVAAVTERFGGLHVLVAGAGILQGAFQAVDVLEAATFRRVLDVNVLGTFLCCKYAAPAIQAAGGGVVLCIASAGGVQGPSSSLAYGASKAGIHGMCRTLERQLEPRGVRVNVVCPGSLDTGMKRQNIRDGALAEGRDPEAALVQAQLGDPDGVAKVLAFLASDDAEYVVGTVFTR